MALTLAMAYLAGWVIATPATYLVSRRLADAPLSRFTRLCLSLLAGLAWPLVLLGVIEYVTVAMYSSRKARRREADVSDRWSSVAAFDHVVAPLR